MKYILWALLLFISFAYGASGLSIAIGEATYNNPEYKESMMDYFQSRTDKGIKDASIEVVRAHDVNRISEDVTGEIYNPDQIFSCAMVDLENDNLTIIVDQDKIKKATPQMYANSLKSAGIEKGYIVVSSPLQSSGETALIGLFKCYETLVGAEIPDEVKKASLEEMYLQTRLVNETGESGDNIARLISEVKNRTESDDTRKIKETVISTADKLDINLTSAQVEDISQVITDLQKVNRLTTNFKERLENKTHGAGLEDQLYAWLKNRYGYIINLLTT